MTVGKITGSIQDILYVLVRPETGEYLETVIGGTSGTRDVTGTFGEDFQAGSLVRPHNSGHGIRRRPGPDNEIIQRPSQGGPASRNRI